MKNSIGVMQGRLLPKYQGRYQAHPVGYWQQEFQLAQAFGLDCIEFILDYDKAENNPLLTQEGVEEIKLISECTGVLAKTICADYFMEAPLHSADQSIADNSLAILVKLLESSLELGITDIVIPCVDQSSLSDAEAVAKFIDRVSVVIPTVESNNINLSLETDLDPENFSLLLEQLGSDRITVNYDIGNSASLGYDIVEELDAYGAKISDIHIKDRVLGGGPVVLGSGNADFDLFFSKLKDLNYQGPFIMQAYRDDEGVEVFKKQLDWVYPYLMAL